MFEICEMMPHRHCLADDPLLMYGFTLSNVITVLLYFVIAYCFFNAGNWGVKNGHWKKLCNSVAFVFLFCSLNYIMQSIVIWTGCYKIQLIVTWLGVIASFKAIYHIIRIGSNALGNFIFAVKNIVKENGL